MGWRLQVTEYEGGRVSCIKQYGWEEDNVSKATNQKYSNIWCLCNFGPTNKQWCNISLGLAMCTYVCLHSHHSSSCDCLIMEVPTEPVKHRGGTTPEQFKFLDLHKDDYIKMRQAKGKEKTALKNAFWPPLYKQWFEKYPVTIEEDPNGMHLETDTALLMNMACKGVECVRTCLRRIV